MRGLLKAASLFAPALAWAIGVPGEIEDVEGGRATTYHSSALISVEIPPRPLNEGASAIALRFDVFQSEEACGFANATVDGQALRQTLDGDVATGKGSIATDSKSNIVASWSFNCIRVNGQPDSQFLRLIVDSVDGRVLEDVGFSALFRQVGTAEIFRVETDLTIPDDVVANSNTDRLHRIGHEDQDFPQSKVEQDMDDLRPLKAQIKELEHLIRAKEQAIAEHASAHCEEEIKDCDSLKCFAKVVLDKAQKAAQNAFNRIQPHDGARASHGTDKAFPKHSKHGDHTCISSNHGNHNAPPHSKPEKRPHHPPGPGFLHPSQHDEMLAPHLAHHGDISHDGPPKGRHGESDHEMGPPHEGHHGPSREGHHGRPFDHPGFEPEAPFQQLDDKPRPPHRSFNGPGSHHPGLGRVFQVVKFVTIGILISLFLIALHRLGRNAKKFTYRKARREARHRRRALRWAARKKAITRFLARISGHGTDDASADYEEKRQALLASAAEDGMSTTMTEEITEFRNAADIVNAMVISAEASRSRLQAQPVPAPITIPNFTPAPSEHRPLLRDDDLSSQVGEGEELPAYEEDNNDDAASEMSSVVADGFRYTPGSTQYTPGDSLVGSVSDILGPNTKQ